MANTKKFGATIRYLAIVIVTFAILQPLVIVGHELTHSTIAWLFDDIQSPFAIVWGNPLMMTGWDEGVHYSELFPEAKHFAEAAIGGGPLLMHALFVVLGLVLFHQQEILKKKWVCHFVYWFIIVNFMELIAYIVMRPFDHGGDTGHFNRGLGLSPWFLFIVGTLVILYGLYIVFKRALPPMQQLFASENPITMWAMPVMTAFFLFLWGSGLRVIFYTYPDPQWMFGLIGLASFAAMLIGCKPDYRPLDASKSTLP